MIKKQAAWPLEKNGGVAKTEAFAYPMYWWGYVDLNHRPRHYQ